MLKHKLHSPNISPFTIVATFTSFTIGNPYMSILFTFLIRSHSPSYIIYTVSDDYPYLITSVPLLNSQG
jgi:hypothetical protein